MCLSRPLAQVVKQEGERYPLPSIVQFQSALEIVSLKCQSIALSRPLSVLCDLGWTIRMRISLWLLAVQVLVWMIGAIVCEGMVLRL